MEMLFLQNIGVWPMILIVLVVIVLFGGKKIPEMMKGLGQGMKEFKDATKDATKGENEEESSK